MPIFDRGRPGVEDRMLRRGPRRPMPPCPPPPPEPPCPPPPPEPPCPPPPPEPCMGPDDFGRF